MKTILVLSFFLFFVKINVYPQNNRYIDYNFSITQNGIYFFDENFNIRPIFINDTDNGYNASFEGYEQFENILFFRNVHNNCKSLVFDYLTQKEVETDIRYIESIKFTTRNKLLITGKIFWTDENKYKLEIEFENRNTTNEIIGQELLESEPKIENPITAWYFENWDSIEWEYMKNSFSEGELGYINHRDGGSRDHVLIKLFNKMVLIEYTGTFIGAFRFITCDYNDKLNIYIINVQSVPYH